MYLEIISPEKTIFSGEVNSVRLPGTDGQFEVLNNHAPIISSLNAGQVKIRNAHGTEEFFDINAGFVEVLKNKVVVLV